MRLSLKTWIILLGLGIIAVYFLSDLIFNNSQYLETIHLERKTKNREFKGRNSPLTEPERPSFDSLDYFAPNPEYKFLADLEVYENPETYPMQMTGGEPEQYFKFGKATFELEGKPYSLTLFKKVKEEGQPKLFVPFTDKTNGFETYGGGRFIDLPMPGTNAAGIEIDFNKAYNPFCAYNSEYNCPVPPQENRLQIKIPVGEKTFHK
ncbi:DUF1684 domain-containing protein [Adhaeribacter terreus]|uniref:DUF1684 domain-containing protein n=1 Tax=Adhaeribacter terreus TaxID=529703 RepID=A0ABW0EB32_9BACT